MDMNIKLQPWQTPNFVIGVMPLRPRKEWINPDTVPKWSLKEVDAETLAKMCDDFRAEIFRKAEKPDPPNDKSSAMTPQETSELQPGRDGVIRCSALLGHVAMTGETAKTAADRIAATWKALHPPPSIRVDKWADGAPWLIKELELRGLVVVPV